jgi:hypothetical protein
MAMAHPKHVHVIKNRHGYLMGFSQRGRSYVIGFASQMYVKKVCADTTISSRMFLSNQLHAKDYANYLEDRTAINALAKSNETVALLNIDKRLSIEPDVPRYTTAQIEFEEFLMYPFHKNIGIVLPTQLIKDKRYRLIFECQVVNPSYDSALFQMQIR